MIVMKILFVAPQPFYEERGTPIAVRWAVEALCAQGHQVDLLTYHCGQDVSIPGMKLCRCWGPASITSVPPGFSAKKLFCDVFLCFELLSCLFRTKYDVIHAVEEAIFPVLCFRPFLKAKMVYDMDSSMADQIIEKWPFLSKIRAFLEFFEKMAVRHVDLVLPVCEGLAEKAKSFKTSAPVVILRDMAIEGVKNGEKAENLRKKLDFEGKMALYAGNLEHYQGLELVLECLTHIPEDFSLMVVVIGGVKAHIEACERLAERLGVARRVRFIGPRPVSQLPDYLAQADILLSPRIKGTNTPLKIYSYMLAGKPILATRIYSHTQALDDSCAALCEPDAASMAARIEGLLKDTEAGERLGRAARERALRHHTREAYNRTIREAYGHFF
ncbi:MAG: glycosyltransferase [Spartobacteria bacterium]|nr:glycosyltransferase [Spartobacteria bacterium]